MPARRTFLPDSQLSERQRDVVVNRDHAFPRSSQNARTASAEPNLTRFMNVCGRTSTASCPPAANPIRFEISAGPQVMLTRTPNRPASCLHNAEPDVVVRVGVFGPGIPKADNQATSTALFRRLFFLLALLHDFGFGRSSRSSSFAFRGAAAAAGAASSFTETTWTTIWSASSRTFTFSLTGRSETRIAS